MSRSTCSSGSFVIEDAGIIEANDPSPAYIEVVMDLSSPSVSRARTRENGLTEGQTSGNGVPHSDTPQQPAKQPQQHMPPVVRRGSIPRSIHEGTRTPVGAKSLEGSGQRMSRGGEVENGFDSPSRQVASSDKKTLIVHSRPARSLDPSLIAPTGVGAHQAKVEPTSGGYVSEFLGRRQIQSNGLKRPPVSPRPRLPEEREDDNPRFMSHTRSFQSKYDNYGLSSQRAARDGSQASSSMQPVTTPKSTGAVGSHSNGQTEERRRWSQPEEAFSLPRQRANVPRSGSLDQPTLCAAGVVNHNSGGAADMQRHTRVSGDSPARSAFRGLTGGDRRSIQLKQMQAIYGSAGVMKANNNNNNISSNAEASKWSEALASPYLTRQRNTSVPRQSDRMSVGGTAAARRSSISQSVQSGPIRAAHTPIQTKKPWAPKGNVTAAGSGGDSSASRGPVYNLAVMKRAGTVCDEMVEQLVSTGVWRRTTAISRPDKSGFILQDAPSGLSHNIHLFLGEKLMTERIVRERSQRGETIERLAAREGYSGSGGRLIGPPGHRSKADTQKVLISMGCGEDPRAANYIVGTRSITLKSKMVATLLSFHKNSWEVLHDYLPMTFQMVPRQPLKGDRGPLAAAMLQRNDSLTNGGGVGDRGIGSAQSRGRPGGLPLAPRELNQTYWIAKSSIGCHGDDIHIFPGSRQGYENIIAFIDKYPEQMVWVVSEYISRPLLYNRRKFDVRCWVLATPTMDVYMFEELVMRTSSEPYDPSSINTNTARGRLANITNHCVQAEGEHYAMFEEGNELWRDSLDALVRTHAIREGISVQDVFRKMRGQWAGRKYRGARSSSTASTDNEAPNLENTILPQMYHIIEDSFQAAQSHIASDPCRMTECYQFFGYDFLIDDELKVWLLEINGAPGVAQRLLNRVVADTIELVIQPLFPQTTKAKIRRHDVDQSHNGFVKVC